MNAMVAKKVSYVTSTWISASYPTIHARCDELKKFSNLFWFYFSYVFLFLAFSFTAHTRTHKKKKKVKENLRLASQFQAEIPYTKRYSGLPLQTPLIWLPNYLFGVIGCENMISIEIGIRKLYRRYSFSLSEGVYRQRYWILVFSITEGSRKSRTLFSPKSLL